MKIFSAFFLIFILSDKIFSQDIENFKKAKPFEIHGNLSVQTTAYAMSGAAPRQPYGYYIISGSPTISIYGFQLPFTFNLSNNQRDFRQPFNQIGVSPQYKKFKFHLGYRSITLSQFGMAGHVILGGGTEFTIKKFRFAALYGRSQRAVAEDSTKNIEQNLNGVVYPTYKQMLGAVKIGYGTESNFFDLYALKGKDDTTSLPYKPLKTEVLPAENIVLGILFKYSFFKNKLEWNGEAAASAFTRDITLTTYDLSNSGYSFFQKIMKPNLSTQAYTAAESQIKYKHKLFSVGGKYRRIEPDYKSMGAYYFQTDIEQFIGNFSTRILKNKISFNGSAGLQHDNVAQKKLATTQRNIYSAALNYQQNQYFGVDINFSNYGTAQKAGLKSLSDTTKINQINSSVIFTPHYIFKVKKNIHTVFFTFGNQSLNDKNIYTSNYTQVNMTFSNLMYSISNAEKKMNYNFGINYNKSNTLNAFISLTGITGTIAKKILNDKMNIDGSINANATKFNGVANGFIVNTSAGCIYTISKNQSVKANVLWLLNHSVNALAGNSFNEFTFTVRYTFNF